MSDDRMSRVVPANAWRADAKHMGPLWTSESAGERCERSRPIQGLGTKPVTVRRMELPRMSS